MTPLISLERVSVAYKVRESFWSKSALLRAVDDVSLTIGQGESLGIAGETGSGKSSLARAIALLEPAAKGEILVDGRKVSDLRRSELRRLRPQMQMVFQNTSGALDPRRKVGSSVAEPIRVLASKKDRSETQATVERLFDSVGLSPHLGQSYPHELSGGQRQRVCIARAIATNPRLVLCDEPTSGLDVSAQGQIINLLRQIARTSDITYVIVGHSLAMLRLLCHQLAILYCGKVVEIGSATDVCLTPRHPYSKVLVASSESTVPGKTQTRGRVGGLGEMPSPLAPPSGCRFHPQCPLFEKLGRPGRCVTEEPRLGPVDGSRLAACHFTDQAGILD